MVADLDPLLIAVYSGAIEASIAEFAKHSPRIEPRTRCIGGRPQPSRTATLAPAGRARLATGRWATTTSL